MWFVFTLNAICHHWTTILTHGNQIMLRFHVWIKISYSKDMTLQPVHQLWNVTLDCLTCRTSRFRAKPDEFLCDTSVYSGRLLCENMNLTCFSFNEIHPPYQSLLWTCLCTWIFYSSSFVCVRRLLQVWVKTTRPLFVTELQRSLCCFKAFFFFYKLLQTLSNCTAKVFFGGNVSNCLNCVFFFLRTDVTEGTDVQPVKGREVEEQVTVFICVRCVTGRKVNHWQFVLSACRRACVW